MVKSRHNGFVPGDIVRGRTGWCTGAVINGDLLRKVETHGAPVRPRLASLACRDLLLEWSEVYRQARAGETVAVAAASGPLVRWSDNLQSFTGRGQLV